MPCKTSIESSNDSLPAIHSKCMMVSNLDVTGLGMAIATAQEQRPRD
jgi:hypothetical protein